MNPIQSKFRISVDDAGVPQFPEALTDAVRAILAKNRSKAVEWHIEAGGESVESCRIVTVPDADGRLSQRDRARVKGAFSAFAGMDVSFTVKKVSKARSSAQNRYYWGVMVDFILQELVSQGIMIFRPDGQMIDREYLHELLKLWCSPEKVVNTATGEEITIGKSTQNMTVDEFSEYMDRVHLWCIDFLGCAPPSPGDRHLNAARNFDRIAG